MALRKARCTLCGESKRLSAFAPSELNPARTSGRCRSCKRIKRAAYRDRDLARLHEWRETHPEAVRDSAKLWRKSNAARIREYKKRRAQAMRENGGTHTEAEWSALVARFGGICLACGRDDLPLTKDHVLPVWKGGRDDIQNLQPLCASCNSSKGCKAIDYRGDYVG